MTAHLARTKVQCGHGSKELDGRKGLALRVLTKKSTYHNIASAYQKKAADRISMTATTATSKTQ